MEDSWGLSAVLPAVHRTRYVKNSPFAVPFICTFLYFDCSCLFTNFCYVFTENYLELFLLECYNRNGSIVDAEALALAIAANSYRPNLFLPSSIPSKLSSGSTSAKQAVPEVKTQTHEFMVKSAAFHCIRSMHGAIMKYGYGSRISGPCDINLDMCKRWLSHVEFDIDLTPARIVKMTEPAGTGTAPADSSISDARADPAVDAVVTGTCPSDGLFVTYDELTVKNTTRLDRAPNRGSKENWQNRFAMLSQSKEKIDCETFVASLCNGAPAPIVPATGKPPVGRGKAEDVAVRIDRKDYQVLMLIVTGQYPTHKAALIREYLHEYNNFVDVPPVPSMTSTTVDRAVPPTTTTSTGAADVHEVVVNSNKRRNILKKVIYPPKIKPEDKFVAAAQFWKRVVEPILAIGAPDRSLGSAASSTTNSSGTDTARKNAKEELLASPPTKASAWSSKFGKSPSEDPKNRVNAGMKKQNSDNATRDRTTTESGEPPAVMTWSVYRDVILAGIEWLIDHEMDT